MNELENFLRLLQECKSTVLATQLSANHFLTNNLLHQLDNLIAGAKQNSIKRNATSIGIDRIVAEFDLPQPIIDSVEKVYSYYKEYLFNPLP